MQNAASNRAQVFPLRKARRKPFGIFGVIVILVVVAAAFVLTGPWMLHIGNQWTPLLTWTGTGNLVTRSGTYPLFISLYPSSHSSRLRLDGLRPTGGVQGRGWMCVSRGNPLAIELSGTIYDAWRTTDGALMGFRVLEFNGPRQRLLGDPSNRGYFDLYGHWRGTQLVMDDRGAYSKGFRSGLKIERASVTFQPGSKSEFNNTCASMGNVAGRQ